MTLRLRKRAPQLAESGTEEPLPRRKPPRGLPATHRGKRQEGEEGPPDTRRGEADPDRLSGRQAEGARTGEEDQVQEKEDAASEVPERPSHGGDGIAVFRRRDVGQPGVVEDHRGPEADVRQQEQPPAHQVPRPFEEIETHGRRGSGVGEEEQHRFLPVGVVGDRPQQRQEENLEEDGQGDDVREERPREDGDAERVDVPRGVGGGAGDGGQIRPREHRDDRRGEGRIREIVEVPADALGPAFPG